MIGIMIIEIEELKKIIEEKEEMIKSINQQINSLEGNLESMRLSENYQFIKSLFIKQKKY